MEKEMYELTYPQKNIWLVDKFNENTAINNIAGSIDINKDFDVDTCKEAINKFICINDSTRIRITMDSDIPKQYVENYEERDIDVFDFSDKTIEEARDFERKISMENIPLIDSDLIYFMILKFPDNKGAIYAKLHHMVCDAWTISLLVTEISEIYDNIKYNKGLDLSSTKPSYIDYILSEKEYINSDKYIKDEEFWKEYLNNCPKPVDLKRKNSLVGIEAKRYTKFLDKDINDRINSFCKENKVSPYVLFLSALAVYIGKIRDVNEFILGTPILNRGNFKEKQMTGMFVSTIPVRFNIDNNKKFIDVLLELTKDNMSIFRHQKYPYSKTLEYVHNTTDIKENLYNVVFSYQNARAKLDELSGSYHANWDFSGYQQETLAMHVMDINNDGILQINYDYLIEVFNDIEIEYLHNRLMNIITNVLENADIVIRDLDVMTEAEKDVILNKFNGIIGEYDNNKTVIDVFLERVNKTPQNTAIVFKDKKLSYEELDLMSNSISCYLKEMEVNKGDIVAIKLGRSYNIFFAILGILKVGAAYLPIEIDAPKDRIDYMLEDSNAKLVIDDNMIDKILLTYENSKFDIVESKSEDIAYVMYTSGTTGKPKGVRVTNKGVINLLYAIDNVKKLSDEKTALSICKYTFDMFVIENIIPLLLGIRIIMLSSEDSIMPDKIADVINKEQVQIIFITPSKLELILLNEEYVKKISSLKKITIAGEVFKKSSFDILRKYTKDADIFNGYGPTEATVCSSVKLINDINDINIGKPLANTYSYILNSNNELMPIMVEGELCIAGDGLCAGYLNNTRLNKEKFIYFNDKKVYKTGDICRYNFNGELEYVGRIDNQIKINGQRIELEEIDSVIKSIDGVGSVITTVYNNLLISFIYTNDKEEIENIIDSFLVNKLPKYMIPNKYIYIDKLYLNSSGKIDKKKLISLYLNDIENKEVILPENDTQKKVYDIIKKNVNINNVSITDNVFNIGIDSLKAINIVLELNNIYNIELTVSNIYANNTIQQIAKLIELKLMNVDSNISKEEITDDVKASMFKLTNSQKRLFASYTSNTESLVYNMPCEIKLNKNVNIERLEKAINNVIRNEHVFNLKLDIINSETVFIEKLNNIHVKCKDTTEKVYRKFKKSFVKPFDLLSEYLFKIELYKTDKNVYILFDAHHIIFDGISMPIFLEKLKENYEEKEFKNSYFKEFLLEEENRNISKDADKFFNKMFEQEVPKTAIITDYLRKNELTFNGDKISTELNGEFAENIRNFCKNIGITENTLFMTALFIVLSKYTYQDNVIIGTVTSDRKKKEYEDTIGMFVNTIPLLNVVGKDIKVFDYLTNNFKDILKLIEYSNYSIDKLVNSLHLTKDRSRNTLFDIMYVYQNTGYPDIKLEGASLEISPIIGNITKFDMTLEVMPNNNNYVLNFEYNVDLYKKIKVEGILNNIINCLKSLIESNERTKVSDIKIISEAEENKILNEFNNTYYKIPKKSVNKIFEDVVEKYKNKTAIVFEERKLTYDELNKRANQVANLLIKNGVKKGDIVTVMMDKSLELLIGIIGILKAGAVYLPIDISAPKTRIEYIINDCNSKIAIVNDDNIIDIKDLTKINIGIMNLYSEENIPNLPNINNQDDIAYIMYTSGSTGEPKGVMIPHKAINRLILHNNFIKLNSQDRILLTGSIAFDATTFEYYGALFNGLPLHIIPKEKLLNPIYLKKYIDDNFITTMWMTAPLFNQMAEFDTNIFANLKNLLVGGDVLSSKHIYMVKDKCPNINIINGYGPTENTTFTTCFNIDGKYDKIPIGKPITNTFTYIIDKAGSICPIYVPGELYTGGMGLSKGYMNHDELTTSKFIDNYITGEGKLYKTGDFCYFDERGVINFVGRIDTQVKINGFRIEPDEIRAKIISYVGIKDVFVKIEEENDKKFIVAYYTCNKKIIADDLKAYLKSNLPGYMQPKILMELKSFPLNQNGKIDKNKLPKAKLKAENNKVLPRNKLETAIYNIFKEVLNSDNFSVDDDFFDIGGDSLMVNQLVIKAIAYDIKLTYADVFNNPTVEKLAYYVENKKKLEEEKLDEKYMLKLMAEEDYHKYNEILELQDNKIKYNDNNIKNVLLTGATGFLGAHIIEQLLLKTNANIYCIVRDKGNNQASKRIEDTLRFFFKDKYVNYINNRIFVLDVDITQENVANVFDEKASIFKGIDLCIHSAAIVKHYGKLKPFVDVNVIATKDIADMCKKYKIKLAYISTLSISGNVIEGGNEEQTISTLTDFSEKNLYIGQNLTNIYARTKFEAEKNILDEMLDGLNACIIRVGNLTGRVSDGKFQPNVEENAFSNRLKSMIEIGVIPENLMKFYVEFTPIDSCSEAIVKLLTKTNFSKRIFHLFNDNHVYMENFLKSIAKLNINIAKISDEDFASIITKFAKENKTNLLSGIIGDLNKDKQLNYISNIIVKEDITKEILKEINFSWPVINEKYILKYIKYLNDIGFIKLK